MSYNWADIVMSSQERVLLVNGCGPGNTGGVETVCRAVAAELCNREIETDWLNLALWSDRIDTSNPDPLPAQVVQHKLTNSDLLRQRLPSPQRLMEFRRLIQDLQPRSIVFNGLNPYFLPLLPIASRSSAKVTQIVHGDLDYCPSGVSFSPGQLPRYLYRAFGQLSTIELWNTTRIQPVAVAHYIVSQLESKGLRKPAIVCHPPTSLTCTGTRLVDNFSPPPRIISVSRLSPEKGTDLFFSLAKAINFARFNLVGPAHNSKYYQACQELAQSTGVCLQGPLYGSNLCHAYLSNDLFVTMSPQEGFGLTTVEALMFGLPVIARRCPASTEIFNKFTQYPGIIVGPKPSDCLEQARSFVAAYADQPQIRGQLASIALESRQIFDPSALTHKLVDTILN